jgi:pyrroloquinoline quinone biosynthesis protein A
MTWAACYAFLAKQHPGSSALVETLGGIGDFLEGSFHELASHSPALAGIVWSVFRKALGTIHRNRRHRSRRYTMKWQTPAASDMRFGFEITMYIANR